ncbi:MAG: dienelactone hydrolase family protein [Myxococcota bacterium]
MVLEPDDMRALAVPCSVHIGTECGYLPKEVAELIQRELGERPGQEVSVYDGAGHAFYNPHHPGYSPTAAEQAHERLIAFLRANLI